MNSEYSPNSFQVITSWSRVPVAVKDGPDVVTATVSSWSNANCLRRCRTEIQQRTNDGADVYFTRAEGRFRSEAGGAGVSNEITVGAKPTESYAVDCLTNDSDHNRLITATETVAGVIKL